MCWIQKEKKITKEAFQRFREQWEGRARPSHKTKRQIEKRIDHRHHLIDALVIALTSRSLYQELARRYVKQTEAMEDNKRNWYIEPPICELRKVATDLAKEPHITHKPDRYPSGRFFDDTAYQIVEVDEGARRLSSRKTLLELAAKSKEGTLKNLETIVSEEVRDIVIKAFKERYDDKREKPNKAALAQSVTHPGYGTVIRRVRCFLKGGGGFRNAGDAVAISHGRDNQHTKYLLNDGYACLKLAAENDKPELLTLADFNRHRKDPNARYICKGDTVMDKKGPKYYIVCIIKKANGGTLCLKHITATRNFDTISNRAEKKTVSGKNLAQLESVGESHGTPDRYA